MISNWNIVSLQFLVLLCSFTIISSSEVDINSIDPLLITLNPLNGSLEDNIINSNNNKIKNNVTYVSAASTFPSVSVDIAWGLPVEVQIIASLPKGTGDLLYQMSTVMQSQHPEYILEFNEASSKIMNTKLNILEKK